MHSESATSKMLVASIYVKEQLLQGLDSTDLPFATVSAPWLGDDVCKKVTRYLSTWSDMLDTFPMTYQDTHNLDFEKLKLCEDLGLFQLIAGDDLYIELHHLYVSFAALFSDACKTSHFINGFGPSTIAMMLNMYYISSAIFPLHMLTIITLNYIIEECLYRFENSARRNKWIIDSPEFISDPLKVLGVLFAGLLVLFPEDSYMPTPKFTFPKHLEEISFLQLNTHGNILNFLKSYLRSGFHESSMSDLSTQNPITIIRLLKHISYQHLEGLFFDRIATCQVETPDGRRLGWSLSLKFENLSRLINFNAEGSLCRNELPMQSLSLILDHRFETCLYLSAPPPRLDFSFCTFCGYNNGKAEHHDSCLALLKNSPYLINSTISYEHRRLSLLRKLEPELAADFAGDGFYFRGSKFFCAFCDFSSSCLNSHIIILHDSIGACILQRYYEDCSLCGEEEILLYRHQCSIACTRTCDHCCGAAYCFDCFSRLRYCPYCRKALTSPRAAKHGNPGISAPKIEDQVAFKFWRFDPMSLNWVDTLGRQFRLANGVAELIE